MHSLGDVGCVNEVVVGVAVLAVALFQASQEVLKDLDVYLEFPDEIVAPEQFVPDVLEGVTFGRLVHDEHIERPIVDALEQRKYSGRDLQSGRRRRR